MTTANYEGSIAHKLDFFAEHEENVARCKFLYRNANDEVKKCGGYVHRTAAPSGGR